MNRRHLFTVLGGSLCASSIVQIARAQDFSLRYVLASALYGDLSLDTVLAEVAKSGAESIDIWRKVHATQREQITEMGDEAFQTLLKKHGVKMSVSTCYPLGAFGQDDELRWVKKNGGSMTVTGAGKVGSPDATGAEAKSQVKAFFEKVKPHVALAEELGLTMAIENHKNSLLSSPDSIRYFVDLNPSRAMGIAFAPHHLYDVVDEIPSLIRHCGKENLPLFYFQEFHESAKKKMEKSEELKQLPGKGTLDYVPIVAALKEVDFTGLGEIFMHPTPRGFPVLPTAGEITDVVNESRHYLDGCLKKI